MLAIYGKQYKCVNICGCTNRNDEPLEQYNVPPGPPPSLRSVTGVSASSRIPVEPHGSPHGHQLTLYRPNLLRVRLGKRQIMAPNQLELHKLKGVRIVVVFVPLQSGLHEIVVLSAQLIVSAFRVYCGGEGGQELMAGRQVPYNEG